MWDNEMVENTFAAMLLRAEGNTIIVRWGLVMENGRIHFMRRRYLLNTQVQREEVKNRLHALITNGAVAAVVKFRFFPRN